MRLRNSLGQSVDLAKLRGNVVLVTFLYTHCPDTCPLIVSHLRTVLSQLGPQAAGVRILAVSTDPKGDSAAAVNRFLHQHRMTGKIDYLVGSRRQLRPIWARWHIAAKPIRSRVGLVAHSSIVYGIDTRGRLATHYRADFNPAQISHDVPLLERG